MKAIKLALWMAITLAFLVCSVSLMGNNADPLSVKIFTYVSPTYPTWVVLLACTFLGAALSGIFFVFELIVLETRNIRLRRLNQKLERALSAATASSPTNGSVSMSVGSPTIRPATTPASIDDSDV